MRFLHILRKKSTFVDFFFSAKDIGFSKRFLKIRKSASDFDKSITKISVFNQMYQLNQESKFWHEDCSIYDE